MTASWRGGRRNWQPDRSLCSRERRSVCAPCYAVVVQGWTLCRRRTQRSLAAIPRAAAREPRTSAQRARRRCTKPFEARKKVCSVTSAHDQMSNVEG